MPTDEQCVGIMHRAYVEVMNEVNRNVPGYLRGTVRDAINERFQDIVNRVCASGGGATNKALEDQVKESGGTKQQIVQEGITIPTLVEEEAEQQQDIAIRALTKAFEKADSVFEDSLPELTEAQRDWLKREYKQAREDLLSQVKYRDRALELIGKYPLPISAEESKWASPPPDRARAAKR